VIILIFSATRIFRLEETDMPINFLMRAQVLNILLFFNLGCVNFFTDKNVGSILWLICIRLWVFFGTTFIARIKIILNGFQKMNIVGVALSFRYLLLCVL
jgi:hypothetical protein